ncbi:MAG: hypothetical protein AABW59_04240 [archaeon]
MKRPSVKSVIQRTPRIKRVEVIFSKELGKPIEHFSPEKFGGISSRRGVSIDIDLFTESFPKSHLVIHTHLPCGKAAPNAMPSVQDIDTLSALMRAGKAKRGVVVSLTKNGKVLGYNVFSIDKPFYPTTLAHIFSKGDSRFMSRQQLLNNYLQWYGVKLKQKYVPMPGYKFFTGSERFEKASKLKKFGL